MMTAAKIDEQQIVIRAGMTEAEIDAALARARELKRAITWGKKKLPALQEHRAALAAELRLTDKAINVLQEGRIPQQMPKVNGRRSPEQKAALAARWTPERRAAAAERLRQRRPERHAKQKAGA